MNTLDSDKCDSESNKGAEEEPEKQCYICWESSETDDNPIRRDCGCKGSGGYVHVRCVVESVEAMGGFLRPWKRCPQCLQPYNDSTKSALKQAMTGDLTKWMRRVLSSAKVMATQLLLTTALFLSQSCVQHVLDYSLDEKIIPLVVKLWNKAVVDYGNHVLSSSIVQLFAIGCTLIGLLYYGRWQILTVLKPVLVALVVLTTLVLVKEFTGVDDWILLGVFGLFCLSFGMYKARAEIRRQGWLATLANVATIWVALGISLFIQYFVVTLYENRNARDAGVEIVLREKAGSKMVEWTYTMGDGILTSDELERVKSEIAFKLKLYAQSLAIREEYWAIREDYWWCCA